MGVGVGIGALAPRGGAVFLNVEDAEELREQRASLGPSAVSCILIGAFLLLLALAPVEKGGDLTAWAIGAGACLIGGVAIGIATRRRADELMRQVSLESSALTLNLALAGLSGWALLSHLGYVRWATPLTLIAGLALLHLAAIFWTAARKGMMKPR
jgi:multisubunit Na+/H+ antiporter MnhB subunit